MALTLLAVSSVAGRPQAFAQLITAHLKTKVYTSEGGRYALKVEPSNPDGGGEATYSLSSKGKEVWRQRLPYTLWDAAVTKDRVIVGYAYTCGLSGRGGDRAEEREGKLLAIRINSGGNAKIMEEIKRSPGPIDGGPVPFVGEILCDEPNDRVILRISVEDWRIYRLSTGALIGGFNPEDSMERPKFLSLTAVHLVPGTPLILVYWLCYDKIYGAIFTLIDSNGKPVWKLDFPIDQKAPFNLGFELVRTRGRILETKRDRSFDILLQPENKCVTFVVTAKGGGWSVQEVARADYRAPAN